MATRCFRPLTCAFAAAIATLALWGAPASAQTPSQEACINSLNKDLQKVSSAQASDITACMRDIGRGLAMTLDDCIAADRKGKVTKAADKTLSDFAKQCTGTDKNGFSKLPSFGPTDAAVVNQVAKQKDLRLLDDIFGPDPNAAILLESVSKEGARCQQGITKTMRKCQDAMLKEFNKCKKTGLRDDVITNGTNLWSTCLQAVIDDPNGKIAKACDDPSGPDGIRKGIDKQCVAKGFSGPNLQIGFPGCDTVDPEALHACVAGSIACGVCLSLAEADGLDSSVCDTFDNGLADGSCGCGDGVPQAVFGEECDDGNLSDNDGCDSQCVVEFCGDGIIQSGIGETCEDNGSCAVDEECNSSCTCTCDPGLTECSGDCVDAQIDESNCGGCGIACDFDEICSAGSCVCPPGLTLCGGACVDTDTDTTNCGTCGTTCDFDEICSAGSCVCPPGQTLCSGACTNLGTDEANCGSCGNTCTNSHGSTECVGAACDPTCSSLFGDCDSDPDDGCETSLSTLTNCGNCGVSCALANAGETCTTGSCLITSCNTQFCNEDGSQSNGCERDLEPSIACPGSAVFIGSVSGDTGSGSVSNSDEGEKWLRVTISENDSGIFSCNDLSATITLVPPAGTDYDLFVFCDNCTTSAGSSAAGGSATDVVQVRWAESCVLGVPTGSESGRDIYIRVEHFSANICNDWSLTVQGNTSGGSNTCSEK